MRLGYFVAAVASLLVGCAKAEPLELELPLDLLSDAGPLESPGDPAAIQQPEAARIPGCATEIVPCTVGQGVCLRTGIFVCVDGLARCSADPGTRGVEVCANGEDDDCDGYTDEAPDAGCCTDGDCAGDEVCTFAFGEGVGGGQCVAAPVEPPSEIDEEDVEVAPTPPAPAVPPEPGCGNGVVDEVLGETCDTAIPGTTTFKCSPTCQRRSLYGKCSNPVAGFTASPECNNNDPGQACTLLAARSMCLPTLSADGTCPSVVGYKQGQAAGLCVITCRTPADCPTHLPLCEVTPVADDPATGTCLPRP